MWIHIYSFVSRIHAKDNYHHSILLAQRYSSAASFAQVLGVEPKQLWGNLRTIIRTALSLSVPPSLCCHSRLLPFRLLLEMLQKLEDGKYLLLKDASKPSINIFRLPANAFSTIGASATASAAPPVAAASASASAAADSKQDDRKK